MSETEIAQRRLTKALLLSVALGVLPLATVGCMPVAEGPVFYGSERQQYFETLRSGGPQDVDAFLAAYPDSRFAPPLLNGLPPRMLARLSPGVVANLSPRVIARLSPAVKAQLRLLGAGAGPSLVAEPASDTPVAPSGPTSAHRGY